MATAADETTPGGAGKKLRTENSNSNGILSSDEQMLKQVAATITTFPHRYFHETTIENLPEEILSNISIRLLAKQLAQMRCVSKSWNVLLSQFDFIKSHIYRSIRNNNHDQVLLIFPKYSRRFTEYSYSDQSPYLEPTNLIKHTPDNLNLPMKVIGAVNGLICLCENHYSKIHIWNPSLSAVSTIPPPHSNFRHGIKTFMRFGFDPKTDDYKIVKLSGATGIGSVRWWQPVHVYSMRKGSWELITERFPSHITLIRNDNYLCVDGYDGHLHWENRSGVLRTHTIVAFDLGLETFSEIPLPDSILDSDHGWHRLGVLSRKLCEMSWRKDGVCEVWVMEEYGVPESWVRRHVFSEIDIRFSLHGFTLRNELLLTDTDGRLVLYDPNANTTKLTRTKQCTGKFVEYVDSLVWV